MCSGQRGEINNQILGVKGLKRTNRHKITTIKFAILAMNGFISSFCHCLFKVEQQPVRHHNFSVIICF